MKSLRVFTRSQFMRTARQHNAVVRSDTCRTGIRQAVLFDVSTGYISIASQVPTHLTVPKMTLICLFIMQILWRCDLY